MKTPREVLFKRHESIEARLDQTRLKALEEIERSGATVSRTAGRQREFRTRSVTWQDFLLSIRWHLAGLSAAWLMVGLLNIELSPGTSTAGTQAQLPTARQFAAAVEENRRQVRELSGATLVEMKDSDTAPRSGLQTPMLPWRADYSNTDGRGSILMKA